MRLFNRLGRAVLSAAVVAALVATVGCGDKGTGPKNSGNSGNTGNTGGTSSLICSTGEAWVYCEGAYCQGFVFNSNGDAWIIAKAGGNWYLEPGSGTYTATATTITITDPYGYSETFSYRMQGSNLVIDGELLLTKQRGITLSN